MATLTDIATEVFDAVAAELSDVIKEVTLTRTAKGTYDAGAGTYPTTTQTTTGRGLAESDGTVARGITTFTADFPHYVVTGKETLWFIAEVDFAPIATDKFTVGDKTYEVKAVRDILMTGELFRVLVV